MWWRGTATPPRARQSYSDWFLMFAMSLFSFLLLFTLLEVLAFQERVRDLTGDAEVSRRVVLATDQSAGQVRLAAEHVGQDDYLRATSAVQVALSIDRLNAAVEKLKRVEGAAFHRVDQDEGQEAQGYVQDIYFTGRGLRALFKDYDDSFALAVALERIGRAVDGLEGVAKDAAVGERVEGMGEGAARRLRGLVRDAGDALAKLDPNAVSATRRERLREGIARFESALDGGPFDVAAAGGPGDAAGDDGVVVLPDPPDPKAALRDLLDEAAGLRGMGEARTLVRALLPFEAGLEGLEGSAFFKRLRDGEGGPQAVAVATGAVTGAEEPVETFLRPIKAASDDLIKRLDAFDPNFTEARDLSIKVNAIEGALRELDRYEIGVAPADDGATATQHRAITFDEARGQLAAAVAGLNEAFLPRPAFAPLIRAFGDDPSRNEKAVAIWHEYQAVTASWPVFQAIKDAVGIEVAPVSAHLVTLGQQSLEALFVLVMGAIGSLIYIVKDRLGRAMNLDADKPPPPPEWVLFRPFFGAIVAFAIYLLFRSGQLALGAGGEGAPLSGSVNLPIVSIAALIAGLLAEQTLAFVEERGSAFFKAETRRDLWAVGLAQGLAMSGHTAAEAAGRVGRSVEQVERWISLEDKVTPEMQDRFTTWLDLPVKGLFGEGRR